MNRATGIKRQRSCVACRKQLVKADLHRLVRVREGVVAYDDTGKVAGRGAYVCSQECFRDALETKRLERALRTILSSAEREELDLVVSRALSGEKEQ